MKNKDRVPYREELKELFRLDTKTACNTADLLADYPNCAGDLPEGPLSRVAAAGAVSHVYLNPAKAMEESLPSADKPGQGGAEGGQAVAGVEDSYDLTHLSVFGVGEEGLGKSPTAGVLKRLSSGEGT